MTERPPVAATPMAFVRAMAQAYALRGISPTHALAQAQITPESLEQAEGRITAGQMERLSDAAMRELDDEALGWFRRPLPWGSYGMLLRASISSPTLAVALKRWCRHHGLLCRDMGLELHTATDTFSITLTEHDPAPWLAGEMREFCHVSLLRNLLGVASWLVDSRMPLQGVELAYPAPPHASAYAVLFAGPCAFDAPCTRLHLDARYLQLPLRRDEAALQRLLQHALPLTVRHYRRDRLLVQRVRQALAALPHLGHNADDLAAQLAVSARTLHRQLRDEGASLQTLKDEVRRDRAMELLLRTDRPIKQVADAAGFQNEKSFIRAFKGWTGATPGEWRRQRPLIS
ncbi:MAG: AraC family transcriptional regulator [Burkholderiaceae bacterium]|nr:AraC family transcriptional regulator [Burkholderiaceae bacterium]